MILQLCNIVGGALLISSKVKEKVPAKPLADFLNWLTPYQEKIGVAVAVLGLVGLLERLGLFYIPLRLGASFPQTLPAIALGLLMGAPIIRRYAPFLGSTIDMLNGYRTYIGLIAILSGLGSLLFGCISPILCHVPF